jgi:hypothetical protein
MTCAGKPSKSVVFRVINVKLCVIAVAASIESMIGKLCRFFLNSLMALVSSRYFIAHPRRTRQGDRWTSDFGEHVVYIIVFEDRSWPQRVVQRRTAPLQPRIFLEAHHDHSVFAMPGDDLCIVVLCERDDFAQFGFGFL